MLVLVVVGGLLSAASALSSPPGMSHFFPLFSPAGAPRRAFFGVAKQNNAHAVRPSVHRSVGRSVCLIETEIRRRLSPPSE